MRKILTLLCAIVIIMPAVLSAQELPYEIDNGSIVVAKIVEDIPGDMSGIYIRAKNYFARTYRDGNAVIQTDDKETGTIIGKGLYRAIKTFGMGARSVDGFHVLRIDIKDGRARIICSAETLHLNIHAHPQHDFDYQITDHPPFVDKAPMVALVGITKNNAAETFDQLIIKMHQSVEECAKTLIEGGALDAEKEDW